MADRTALTFHHAGISVPDLEASIAWYGEVLGFELSQRIAIDAIPAKVAMLKRGPLRIELFEVPGATPAHDDRRHPNRDPHTHGNKHVAFAVKDVDAMVAEFKDARRRHRIRQGRRLARSASFATSPWHRNRWSRGHIDLSSRSGGPGPISRRWG